MLKKNNCMRCKNPASQFEFFKNRSSKKWITYIKVEMTASMKNNKYPCQQI